MSGSRTPHLQRRQGTYHLRVRVPDELRLRVGLLEVRRSLRVHTLSEARPLALKYAARVMEIFDVVRTQAVSREDIRAMVLNTFEDLRAEVDDGVPDLGQCDQELAYNRHLIDESIVAVQAQLETRSYRHPVAGEVLKALHRAGVSPTSVSAARMEDLNSGIARALIEQDRLLLFRMAERLLPYEPSDPLFSSSTLGERPVPAFIPQLAVAGPSVQEAVEVYLAAGAKTWVPKTLKGRRRQLAHLVEHLGGETKLAAVTAQDVLGYRDAIRRMRSNHRQGASGSFASKQTDNEAARISDKTACLIFEPCKAFFGWAKSEQGYLAVNPAADVRMPRVKKTKAVRGRRPFTTDELEQLFSAPVFKGMKAPKRRFEPGDLVLKNAYYWIPILGLYTGARLGELVQLHQADIHLDGPVPFLDITEIAGGEGGSGDEKHVKSAAGVRRVPLHPDLLELGFGEFVAKRKKEKRRATRLFWEIRYGADGQPSTIFSKWFGRMLDKVGLSDPALVFHSFRHTVEDSFRDALMPQYVIDRVIGHSGGKTSDGYGVGISLNIAYEAVKSIKLPWRVCRETPNASKGASDAPSADELEQF